MAATRGGHDHRRAEHRPCTGHDPKPPPVRGYPNGPTRRPPPRPGRGALALPFGGWRPPRPAPHQSAPGPPAPLGGIGAVWVAAGSRPRRTESRTANPWLAREATTPLSPSA